MAVGPAVGQRGKVAPEPLQGEEQSDGSNCSEGNGKEPGAVAVAASRKQVAGAKGDKRPSVSRPKKNTTPPAPHIVALFLAWFAVAAPRLAPTALILGGLLRRWRQRSRTIALMGCTWIASYLYSVRRVHLRLGSSHESAPEALAADKAQSLRLSHIVRRCPSLSSLYWPTWWAPHSLLQVLLLLCKELRFRLLERNPYRRELLTLRDGGVIALDWIKPACASGHDTAVATSGGHSEPPVCVILHGAFMDSCSVTVADLARSLAAKGFPSVIMNRRGYGGIGLESAEEPKVSFFGFDEDLDEVLGLIARRYPGRPVCIVGFSCGSGFATRYTGRRACLSAWKKLPSGATLSATMPRLLCTVAYDGGYDASPEDGPAALMRWPYNWIVNWSVKFFYVFRHRRAWHKAGRGELVDRLLRPTGLPTTYRDVIYLSGAKTTEEFMELQQPALHGIEVPSLLINSRDDPICVWQNVEHGLPDIVANPNLAHAELFCGTHGCKFGFLGFSSFQEAAVAEFVSAAWNEWQAAKAH